MYDIRTVSNVANNIGGRRYDVWPEDRANHISTNHH